MEPVDPKLLDLKPEGDPLFSDKKARKEGFKNILHTVLLLITAPLLAIFITAYVFHSYEVYGPSMQETLHNGDRLIVLKANRTWAKIRGETYMPQRGEIVVFTRPDMMISGREQNKQLIKRVIALPGEDVEVANGKITIYNADHPEGYNPDAAGDWNKMITNTEGTVKRFTIPEGHVFVCGDNRSNSLDSRSFGAIDTKDIVGTAALRIYPFSQMGTIQ